jgi:hypothetical protein
MVGDDNSMLNLEFIAKLCHEVNRAYCSSIGDESHTSWDEAPEWQKKSAINGIKFHIENETKPEDSHYSWMKEKIEDGWIYGEVKDAEQKTHPCIVSYDQLPQEQRSKDYIFKAICNFFKNEKMVTEEKGSYHVGQEVIIKDCSYARMEGIVGKRATIVEVRDGEFDYEVKTEDGIVDLLNYDEVELIENNQ